MWRIGSTTVQTYIYVEMHIHVMSNYIYHYIGVIVGDEVGGELPWQARAQVRPAGGSP